uniref:Aminopeptidase n=2 Tax=Lygus hesperus TaxID=30085 RepID=A0A146LLM8_LYGHE
MRWLYFVFVGLMAVVGSFSSVRPLDDHVDSGICTGESTAGNSPFVPHRYSLYLDLNPEKKTFKGDVNIMGTLSNNTDVITLHSVNLNVNSVRVNGMDLDTSTWYLDEGTLTLTVPPEIFEDSSLENLMVGVTYDGSINDSDGIIMQYYNKTDKNRWIIYTDLEPISARTVFPCIDLPKYKAKFDISIKNPGKRLIVLSNMPRRSRDHKVVKFQTTPSMSTYLVSFVICDYVPVRTPLKKYQTREITTWVPKEMEGKYGATFVGALIPKLLEDLESYTGNTFSLPKLDMFVVMDKPGVGGMENWGLIMYQADSFMQGKRSSASDLRRVVFTIAHELAHHWFGNSVTVADWCRMWLQEAIPTFLHGHIPDKHSYDLDMVNRVKWTARKDVMSSECFFYDYSYPLRSQGNGKEDDDTLFSSWRYYKGASLLYMIESIVTPEVFKQALRSFINKYNNSYVIEDDLWDVVEKQVGEGGVEGKLNAPTSLAEIADTWVTHKSHPVVILNRNEDGSLSVSQKICTPNYTEGEWWIPISYTTSKEGNFKNTKPRRWAAPSEADQPLNITLQDDEWIILNIMGSGFYRVQYDKITWKLLIDQLKRDAALDNDKAVIPPIHRAILVDDSFYLDRTGESLVRAFEIMEYVKDETSAYVWEALLNNVGFQHAVFPEAEKTLFLKYVHYLLKNAFRRVSDVTRWEKAYHVEVESLNERSLREAVFELSYSMELPALFNFSRDVATQIINGNFDERIIPPEVKNKLWCSAVSTEDLDIFEHVMVAYDSEKKDKKKAQILEYLMCSKIHTATLLDLLVQSDADRSKATLKRNVKDFLVVHWPAECEEILAFFEENKKLFVDDESQLASEFQIHVKHPLPKCKDKTNQIFGVNSTDDTPEHDQEFRRLYGLEPLNWLKAHERFWS